MKWFKIIRENSGLTQEKLAQKIGVERSQISKFETESARPSPDTAKAIVGFCVLNLVKIEIRSILLNRVYVESFLILWQGAGKSILYYTYLLDASGLLYKSVSCTSDSTLINTK